MIDFSQEILFATSNAKKVDEFKNIIGDFPINLRLASEFDLVEPEETGKTFSENALLKAKYYAEATNLPTIADDSGLCIDVLSGNPGIYSANWAENAALYEGRDFSYAIRKIEKEIRALGQKANFKSPAQFVCVICYYDPKTSMHQFFEGVLEGRINFPARGKNGMGYDPIFVPLTEESPVNKTMAEIAPELKSQISHRALAVHKLISHAKSTEAENV